MLSISVDDTSDKKVSSQTGSYHLYIKNIVNKNDSLPPMYVYTIHFHIRLSLTINTHILSKQMNIKIFC